MNKLFIGSIARHVLTAFGGALLAKGYVDAGTWEAISGALITLGGAVWSLYEKAKR